MIIFSPNFSYITKRVNNLMRRGAKMAKIRTLELQSISTFSPFPCSFFYLFSFFLYYFLQFLVLVSFYFSLLLLSFLSISLVASSFFLSVCLFVYISSGSGSSALCNSIMLGIKIKAGKRIPLSFQSRRSERLQKWFFDEKEKNIPFSVLFCFDSSLIF